MQPSAAPLTAPKPPPPRSRRRWYLCLGFLVLFFAAPSAFYFINGWARDRELAEIHARLDAEDPNWRWPDLVAAYKLPPEEQNAAAQALKVHGLLQKTPLRLAARWENATPHPLDYRNARLADEHIEMLTAAFGQLDKQVLIEARKLKDMPHGRLKLDNVENPFSMTLQVQDLRTVMNLLRNDAALRAAHPDDLDGAAQSCQALLNTAGAIGDHPLLISQLVRMAGQAIAVAAIERVLAQGEIADKELAALQLLVEREANNNPLFAGMRGERAASEQMIKLIRTGKMNLSGLTGATGGPDFGDRIVDLFPGLLLSGQPDHLRMLNETVRATQLPDTERTDALERLEQEVRKSKVHLTRLLMPAVHKVSMATQRSHAMLRTTDVGIAAERYRLKFDHWPREMAELIKEGFLKETAMDPYDGKPLRLKRTETGLLIYSIGQDKKDDDGKLNRSNPIAAGSDIGFELWDRGHRAVPPPATP